MAKLSRPKKSDETLASFGSPPQFLQAHIFVLVHQLSQEDEGKRLQGIQGLYSLFVVLGLKWSDCAVCHRTGYSK